MTDKTTPTEPAKRGDQGDQADQTDQTELAAPVPAPEVLEVRHGAFGAHDAGDTSGFGGLTRVIYAAAPATRPYGGWFDQAVDLLEEVLAGTDAAGSIEKVVVDHGELTLFVKREHLVAVAKALRDDPDLRFELSLGVNGVHYPADTGRELHAVYHLMSVTHGRRLLRLEVTAPEDDPHIPSLVAVYPTQDWHERETFDMFGIRFDGHPALARILMPDDWVGHPQRKDYPLGGVNVQFKGATVPPADKRRNYS
jgi:NADH-quinone oxidoreductase subunit C